MDDLQYNIEKFTLCKDDAFGFKPCYKWMTFNTITLSESNLAICPYTVLNLVINGWPSILDVITFTRVLKPLKF